MPPIGLPDDWYPPPCARRVWQALLAAGGEIGPEQTGGQFPADFLAARLGVERGAVEEALSYFGAEGRIACGGRRILAIQP